MVNLIIWFVTELFPILVYIFLVYIFGCVAIEIVKQIFVSPKIVVDRKRNLY
jgi:hypothetical protein